MNYLKTWWVEKHGIKYDFDGNLKTIYCFSFFNYEKISIRMFQFHDIYCENLEPSVLLHWVVWIFRNDFFVTVVDIATNSITFADLSHTLRLSYCVSDIPLLLSLWYKLVPARVGRFLWCKRGSFLILQWEKLWRRRGNKISSWALFTWTVLA